jgi:hypothetical protein
MRRKLLFTYHSGVELWVVDVASAKRLNLPNKVNANLGNPAGIATTKHFSKNAKKLLYYEKKIYQQGPLFQMQPAQFLKTGPIKIY